MYVRIIHRSTKNVITGTVPASSRITVCLVGSFSFWASMYAKMMYTM